MPSVSVPQPKKYGPLGNLPHLDLDKPTQSLVKLAEEYGPIFRMEYAARSELYISSEKYVAEVSDETRFDKRVWAPLAKVRAFAGDGLFTSRTDEPNWKKRIMCCSPALASGQCRVIIRKWWTLPCSSSRSGQD